jgi:hypothetical protein
MTGGIPRVHFGVTAEERPNCGIIEVRGGLSYY